MKRRPYLLLLTFSVVASVTLLVVWRERHRQQERANRALIASTHFRSTLPQSKPLVPKDDPNRFSLPTATSATPVPQGADVWVHDSGWNKLCEAAKQDDLSVARKVIQEGVRVNSRDKQRRTPLMYAAAYGSKNVLDLLLAKGADVNARDAVGWTALMFAAQTDDVTIAHALLRHGVNRRLRDHENHWTAEERALHLGQERMAALLRTGQIGSGIETESKWWLGADESAATSPRTQAKVDVHRRIKSVLLSGDSQESSDRECGVVVVDADGKQGKPFESDYYNLPDVQVFHDADGRPYAFIAGQQRMSRNYIVAIQGRTLLQKCECPAYYNAVCQPLRGGGALVIAFETTYNKMEGTPIEGIPVQHQNDQMAFVSRFRHGKLTSLDDIYLPQQE
jgi:hypothetical protein